MVFVLSTSSNRVLYLYQVMSKYLIGFQSYRLDARVITIYQGAQFHKTVDTVIVLNLCTTSFKKISQKGFRVIERMLFEY